MAKKPEPPKRGRPRRGDERVPYNTLDRVLVFGELVPDANGGPPGLYYPSYRELAKRYGVSVSVISSYANKHNCAQRREEAEQRIAIRSDQKLIELRASAIAMSKDDTLRIIDAYLVGFEKSIAEERIRYDSVSDFNTMVRLKEYVQGGADSRQEIHAVLSLEDLQERHKQMMQRMETSTPAERGEGDRDALDGERAPEDDDSSLDESVPEETSLRPGERPADRFLARDHIAQGARALTKPEMFDEAGAEKS